MISSNERVVFDSRAELSKYSLLMLGLSWIGLEADKQAGKQASALSHAWPPYMSISRASSNSHLPCGAARVLSDLCDSVPSEGC